MQNPEYLVTTNREVPQLSEREIALALRFMKEAIVFDKQLQKRHPHNAAFVRSHKLWTEKIEQLSSGQFDQEFVTLIKVYAGQQNTAEQLRQSKM